MMASSSTTMAHSQVPGRPTFRDSAMHAVAIVPLSVNNNSNGAAVGSTNASLLQSTSSRTAKNRSVSSLPLYVNLQMLATRRTSVRLLLPTTRRLMTMTR
jgi:hypothetical protein